MRKAMVLGSLVTLVACGGESIDSDISTGSSSDVSSEGPDPYDVVVGPYEVEIQLTSYGVPHIRAESEGSAGYGLGYIAARDHICVIADQILKTRSERSKYFGPGQNNANVDHDFGWLHLGVRRDAEETFLDLAQSTQDRIVGYAAGYNAYLEETGRSALPPDCRDAEWVKPITHIDLLAYYYSLGLWGSGYNFVNLIGQAQPPAQSGQGEVVPSVPPPDPSVLEPLKKLPMGSNGWAIGAEESETGGGALLSNTHFPMFGERQWHEFHMTIPGELDVYGVSLVGLPMVAMGFNEHVAWTHTVSNTPRFVAYLLKLRGGGDPTSYELDGEYVRMDATDYTIQVLQSDGSETSVDRTLYTSRHGPIWNAPVIGWGLQAMALRDINARNTGMLPTFDGMGRATDLDSFQAAHREHQGIPWVHTLATDRTGKALYMDSAATPNISDQVWERYEEFFSQSFFVRQYADFGLAVFDGSNTAFDLTDDPRAARPGIIPHDDTPRLMRDDYVMNANDNYWWVNARHPLTGYPRIYGPTQVVPSARTRMNHFYLLGIGSDPIQGEDGLWSLDELEQAAYNMRSLGAELLLDDIVARCSGAPPVTVTFDGEAIEVDIAPACDVLAAWDGLGRTDSVGAHVWREMLGSGPLNPNDLTRLGPLFSMPFDPVAPLTTPRSLTPAPDDGPDPIHQALALATLRIQSAGFELTDPLGVLQVRKKGDTTHPTPGGLYSEGYIGIATWSGRAGNTTLLPIPERGVVINPTTGLTDEGYVITNGNSYILALQFDEEGPQARATLVYSQSEDPESPHFDDQARELDAHNQMRPVLFRQADIEADPELTVLQLSLD